MKFWKRIPWKRLGIGLAIFYTLKAIFYLSLIGWAYYHYSEPSPQPIPVTTTQN